MGSALRERLARGERPSVMLQAEVDTGWRKTPILVADIGAGERDAPFVLFSGHHDTWYYGVMDNGSANATMLEVARLCVAQRAQWQRGLRLCFWSGHSHGRYSGSTWYVDEHWDELDRRCVAHINVDSTGADGRRHPGECRFDERVARAGIGGDRGAIRPAPAGQAHEPRCGPVVQRAWIAGDLFGDLSEPVPTPVGAHCWWWHTPDDLADNISENNLVRDTRIYVHALWRLLTDRVLPLDYAAYARDLLAELAGCRRHWAIGCRWILLLVGGDALRAMPRRSGNGCHRRGAPIGR